MKLDTEHFKEKLEEERKTLLEELTDLGAIKDPKNNDWDARPYASAPEADENDLADRAEDFEERTAIVSTLELRLKDVEAALLKIQNGKYGICEVSGEEIEIERLEANPAARTSIKHMK